MADAPAGDQIFQIGQGEMRIGGFLNLVQFFQNFIHRFSCIPHFCSSQYYPSLTSRQGKRVKQVDTGVVHGIHSLFGNVEGGAQTRRDMNRKDIFICFCQLLVDLGKVTDGRGGGDGHGWAGIHHVIKLHRVNVHAGMISDPIHFDFQGDHGHANFLAIFKGEVSSAIGYDFHIFLLIR